MIANGAAKHGVLRLERVQDRALRDGAGDFQEDFAGNVGQGAEVSRKSDANHRITIEEKSENRKGKMEIGGCAH